MEVALHGQLPGARAAGDPIAARAVGEKRTGCVLAARDRLGPGRASRTADASIAWRNADTAWGMGASWRAWRAKSTETSGSADSSFSLSAARAWARAVLPEATAWFRDTRASTPSPMATTVTATLTPRSARCRRAAARRLARTYSLWRVVGAGSASTGVRASQLSAALSSLPRRRKLRSRAFGVPFDGLHQPTGVLLAVLEVGVDGADEALERVVVVVALGERDPVAMTDLLGDVRIRNRAAEHRHDALLEGAGVVDLLLAEL